MKHIVVFIFVLFFTPHARADVPPDTLIAALIQKESSNNDNPTPGDDGTAFGPLQIRQGCIDDVNERCGTTYRAEDMQGNRPLSIWICRRYIDMYATKSRIGRSPTIEDMARIWNGGPIGWKKKSTSRYWQDVRRILLERSS